MKIVNNYSGESLGCPQGSVVTLGTFDGLHLGHQALIKRTVEKAKKDGLCSVVVTFDPHPKAVLEAGQYEPFILLPLDRKLALLEALGVDQTVIMPFSEAIAGLGAEEFVSSMLIKGLNMRELVVGYDHALGRGRGGDAQMLAKLGHKFGFGFEQVPGMELEGGIVSSSRIRKAISENKVDLAARLLGRMYSMAGVVEVGMQRGGKQLGFPTANVVPDPAQFVPHIGGYAVYARIGAKGQSLDELYADKNPVWLKGICNIGSNPTFGDKFLRIETFLFDFDQDIYGVPMEVFFAQWVREEQKFNSVDELIARITADVELAKELLEKIPAPAVF